MPIRTQDIKLLKSAVMADTADGGGAMTGNEVVDGQSNNLFPDTSALDRAFGRVNLRKIYGVAHTPDTDVLLGSHAMVTDAPNDPLVHCCLLNTAGWADTRDVAREAIERYLVKGPGLAVRLYDVHYAGSRQIRLISFVKAPFPAGGDALVLRNPNEQEQYVRVLNVTLARVDVAVAEGSQTLVLEAHVATCDIGQALAYDFYGPPPTRILGSGAWATIFSTNVAGGAKFYGIKPLAIAGVPGDYSVTTLGGIYTPLVPAATIESPIIDQLPLTSRQALINTGMAAVTLTTAAPMAWGPNAAMQAASAVEPGSVYLVVGNTVFTDNRTGSLMAGGIDVGAVDYVAGKLTLSAASVNYGTVSAALTYKPASAAGASSYSAALKITVANQGLAYTTAFEPPPAPGSFALSYMAQGRWYSLADNLAGKVAGLDSSYGVGTLNYGTGSFGLTLGAIPDVGGVLLAHWGDAAAATAAPVAGLPTRLAMPIDLPARTRGAGIGLSWMRGATNYAAATNAAGQLTGDATGGWQNGVLYFEPNVFPDGNVTVTSQTVATAHTAITNNGGGNYTLTGALPIAPGTFKASVLVVYPDGVLDKRSPLPVWDAGGVIYLNYSTGKYGEQALVACGAIDYATGGVALTGSVPVNLWVRSVAMLGSGNWGSTGGAGSMSVLANGYVSAALNISALTNLSYAAGTTTTVVQPVAAGPWQATIQSRGVPSRLSGSVFKLGDTVYSTAGGVVRRGWALNLAAPQGVGGSISSDGLLIVEQAGLPANYANGLVWYNHAQDASAKLVRSGVFRVASAPLKTGVFQLQSGSDVGTANDSGEISGGGFSGTVDYSRGVVRWEKAAPIDPASLSYNAVFLQYLPLDGKLLGLDTARLPLDGKVPVFRTGDLVVVHNTQTLTLPNPLGKNTAYSLGRVRVASVRVKDALGVVVPDTLYNADLNPGTLTIPSAANIAAYTQPLTVEHRIEDMLLCSQADISGQLKFTRSLTHNFAVGTSYASSAMPFGDLFGRVYNTFEQATWTGEWADERIGPDTLASYNVANHPFVVTNRGAITERWALIFTNNTAFRVIGEFSGEVGVGTVNTATEPINEATGAAYFTIPILGWGGGWAAGNVLRFNTAACGSPMWAVRTVLQGAASLDSDAFTLAFRGDVDRP